MKTSNFDPASKGQFLWGVGAGFATAGLITAGILYYCRCKNQAPRTDNHLADMALPSEVAASMRLTPQVPGIHFGVDPEHPEHHLGKPLAKDGHVAVIGQSGSGKTSCIINPSMETCAGFGIHLDVKGELWEHHKTLYGDNPLRKCLVFNPYDDEACNCWYDPFSAMKNDPENKVDYAHQLARTLLPGPTEGENAIWTEAAIAFLTGALIYHYDLEISFVDTLDRINNSDVIEILKAIKISDNTDAKSFVSKFGTMDEKTVRGIGMELESYLPLFTTSKALIRSCTASEGKEQLDWSKCNSNEPFDVFLILPEDKLEVLRPLYRTMVDQLIFSLCRRKKRTYDRQELPPVYVMLDEFPRLGKLPELEHGLSTLRCRGVTLVLLLQSLATLDDVYGESTARILLENCSYQLFLGSNDARSQRYISELIGTTLIEYESGGCSVSSGGVSVSSNVQTAREAVIQPHVLHTLSEFMVLYCPDGAFWVRKFPVIGNKRVYKSKRQGDKLCTYIKQYCSLSKQLRSNASAALKRTDEKELPKK